MRYQARGLIILLVFCFALPALATQRNVQSYGATGNGSTDDTSTINSAIASLVSGDELYFPCPSAYYKTTAALTPITVSNVTVDGQTGCSVGRVKIQSTCSSCIVMQVGGGSLSASTLLTVNSAELATSFTANLANIGGLAAGDYVVLQEGGAGGNASGGGVTTDTTCDISGCRGEVLKIASVNSNTATVTTALHFPYNTVNAANVQKLVNPTVGDTVHDLILNGSGTAGYGLYFYNVADATASNITATNVVNEGLESTYAFNHAWNNVAVTFASNGSSDGMTLQLQGNPSVNGATISSLNNTAFGFAVHTGANGTLTNVTVDKAGSGTGRPCKLTAASHITWNSLTCKNGSTGGYNGLDITYYSAHNTFNNCVVTNNSGHGIEGFGLYDSYNTFVNCTVSGNTNNQMNHGQSASGLYQDLNWEVSGGTYTTNAGTRAFQINATAYIHGVTATAVGGIGNVGLALGTNTSNSCVNNNSFSNFSANEDIENIGGGGSLFNSNTTPDGVNPSPLPAGTCPAGALNPPTGLTARVQ